MRKKKVNESKKREKKEREKVEMLFVNYFDQIKLAIRKIYCIVIIIIISECLIIVKGFGKRIGFNS